MAIPDRDYYKTLGIKLEDVHLSTNASENEWRQACGNLSKKELEKFYRRQAMKLHPDRNPSETAKEKFQLLQEAYAVLSDEQKRAMYDQLGYERFQAAMSGAGGPHTGGGGYDMGDIFGAGGLGSIFGDIFGGGFRSSQTQRAGRGSDLRYNLSLTLEEAVFGCAVDLKIPRLGKCQPCHGSGAQKGSKPVACQSCGGKGQIYFQQGLFNIQQTCPDCGGQGQMIATPCTACRGSGQIQETKVLSVKIPAGIDEGNRIRLSGEGEAGTRGGAAGDLYVQIHLKPHDLFQRDKQSLHCEVPISYAKAVLGGTIEVPALEGVVRVQVPAYTQNGKKVRLKGKGVPGSRSVSAGDLFCTLIVETPDVLNDDQKRLLQDFENSLQGNTLHYPRMQHWLNSMRQFFTRKKKD